MFLPLLGRRWRLFGGQLWLCWLLWIQYDYSSFTAAGFNIPTISTSSRLSLPQFGCRRTSRRKLAEQSTTKTTTTTTTTRETEPSTEPLSKSSHRTHRPSLPWTLDTETYGPFNQHEDWGWCYSTVPPQGVASYECTPDNGVTIEGTVPLDLRGTYYKIGPGNFEREGRRYEHVLDGDGFVTAFTFDQGKVHYTGRFVETEFWRAETATNQILYRNVFGTQRRGGWWNNALDVRLKNVVNTNVLAWGGRLFALWEAGRPYELDPVTLETNLDMDPTEKLGPFYNLGNSDSVRGVTVDQGGPMDQLVSVARSFTAHPVIFKDDTLVIFTTAQNVQTKELGMEFVEYNREWQTIRRVPYTIPQTATAAHDFAVSEKYYCLFQNQFDIDNLPFLLGMKSPTQAMQLALERPNILHLIPRHGGDKAIRIEVPHYFTIHTVTNIVEENDQTLTIYSNGWDLTDERYFPKGTKYAPFLGSWGGPYPDFVNMVAPPSPFYRTTVDLQSGLLLEHHPVIPGLAMEFPKQDAQQQPEVVYMAVASTNSTSLPGTGLAKVNTVTNDIEVWWAEHKVFTGESEIVPKRNGAPGSWIVTILYDADQRRATVGILDSERFADGPVCRIHLPHSLAYALHSKFVPKENDT